MATLDDLFKARWQFIDPTIPYVAETGIATFYRAHPEIGSPIGFETDLDDGTVAQAFSAAIVVWDPTTNGARTVTG